MNILKYYDALGNTKAQKFRRFMLILALIAGVTLYGFYSHSISLALGFGSTASTEVSE